MEILRGGVFTLSPCCGEFGRCVTGCGQWDDVANGSGWGLMPQLISVFKAIHLVPRLRPPWGLTTSPRQVYAGLSHMYPAPGPSHTDRLTAGAANTPDLNCISFFVKQRTRLIETTFCSF